MNAMLEQTGNHLQNIDDSIIKQQQFADKRISELEDNLVSKNKVLVYLSFLLDVDDKQTMTFDKHVPNGMDI